MSAEEDEMMSGEVRGRLNKKKEKKKDGGVSGFAVCAYLFIFFILIHDCQE